MLRPMNDFFAVFAGAIDDATLANELLRDAGYRRWLRDDPSTALSVFDAGAAARPQRNITYERATVSAAA